MTFGRTERYDNLRLLEEIDADTFASKATTLRDEAASLRLQIEATERSHNETIDLFAADVAAKRRILEIIFLNWKLDGVSLALEMRRPFGQVAEGLQKKDSRGDRI